MEEQSKERRGVLKEGSFLKVKRVAALGMRGGPDRVAQ